MDFKVLIPIILPIVLAILTVKILDNYKSVISYFIGSPNLRLPLHKRIYRRLLLLFDSRILHNFEYNFEYNTSTREVESPFYVPRKPILMELHLNDPKALPVEEFMYQVDGEWRTCPFGTRTLWKKGVHIVQIFPADLVMMDSAKVRLSELDERFLVRLYIRTRLHPSDDINLFLRALKLDELQETEKAIELYQEYRKKYSAVNPWAAAELVNAFYDLERYDEAGEYALRALVNGLSEWGYETYRLIQQKIPFLDAGIVEEIREEGNTWKSRSPRGAVVLKRELQFLLGLDDWYLKKFREVLEIRRGVAARRLTRIPFPFDTGNWLLFTNLRVIHPDGEIEVVPDVHFSVQDSSESVLHREKMGVWVLPDLEVGDIVEWSAHLLIKEDIRINDQPHFFIASLLQNRFYPTLKSDTTFRYPAEWKLRFIQQNNFPTLESSSEIDGDWKSTTFHLEKYTPTWGTGFYYEAYHSNPSVACGWKSHRWEEVTRAMIEHQFGEMEIEDEIPPPLAEILDRHEDSEEALRQSFYWLRDKLKYRPFDWAELIIAHEGWAGEIVRSGVANCREKSYILNLICRNLGIRSELVVIPSDRGYIFEDLPSNQFNHVLVRAEVDGEWKYLDATYTGAVFTSSPDGYQGLMALVLDEKGTRITIPEVDPEENRVMVSETFDRFEGHWLAGYFSYRAVGTTARLADEYWKGITIHGRGYRLSAQEAFRYRFPTLILKNYRRTSNTAKSDVLALTGNHKRCHLSSLKGNRVGILEWNESLLMIDYWDTLHPAEVFVFPMPITFEITLNIGGELFARLMDVSQEVNYENSFCRITEHRRRADDRLRIRRVIVIKRKFISRKDLRDLPRTMQNLKKALQVAVSFED